MVRRVRMLTDSEHIKENNLLLLEKQALIAERKKHQKHYKMHSDDTKVEVVKTYLVLGGNLSLTASCVGIPRDTLKTWKASQWWKTLVNEIKQQEKLELSSKTKRILDKTMEILADRVVNGDFVYDQKAGKLIRKPITAQVAHKISVDLIDRVEVLDKDTEEEGDVHERDSKRLEQLAERFATLAVQKIQAKPPVNVTDVIYIENEGTNNAEDQS